MFFAAELLTQKMLEAYREYNKWKERYKFINKNLS